MSPSCIPVNSQYFTMKKHLNAIGRGAYSYDSRHDILFFKIKERDYSTSLEFDELVIDMDTEGFIMGIRLFDASQILRLDKESLSKIQGFEFSARAESGVISVQLPGSPPAGVPIPSSRDRISSAKRRERLRTPKCCARSLNLDFSL